MGSPTNFFELEHVVSPIHYIGYLGQAANGNGVSIDVTNLSLEQNATTRPTVN
jgi:hypothetical protein